jgi:uridine kinase
MTRLVLIAGASGSGKSRLARHTGMPCLRLDDYYFDADHPGMPTTNLGITDWDDPRSWDAGAALAGVQELMETGELEAPAYSIPESRRIGSHHLRMDGASCLVAEGIFAIEFLSTCTGAGLSAEAIYLDRPGWMVYLLRLRRDLAGKRKPVPIAFRRGWALYRAQPALRRKAQAAGFTPLGMRAAIARLEHPPVGVDPIGR